MTRTLEFWETALRDGQQSLWATRMTTPMIAPVADTMGGCGYWCIEVMSGAVYEASYHFNAEDPWERVRLIARASRGNHVAAIIRALSVFGWSTLPDEAFPFAMNVLASNGITLVNLFDGLNDTANIAVPLQAAKERGLHVAATLIFTESPIHTDAYYVTKAKELLALGADSVILEDAASLMTTARLRALVMKLRSAIGNQALFHFQTHCASGLGALNAIEAMRLGIDVAQTAISPLADGTSNPPTEFMVREAAESGLQVRLDVDALDRIAPVISGSRPPFMVNPSAGRSRPSLRLPDIRCRGACAAIWRANSRRSAWRTGFTTSSTRFPAFVRNSVGPSW